MQNGKGCSRSLQISFLPFKRLKRISTGTAEKKSRLDRLNRVKGALAERRAVIARIAESGDVLILPEDFNEKRRKAGDTLHNAVEARERAETRLSLLKEEAAALIVRDELLDNEEAILDIYRGLGAVEKTITDRPVQDGKRSLLRNEAELLLKCVRSDIDIDDAEMLRPLTNNKKLISGLAQKHSLLNEKKENEKAALRDEEDKQEKLKKELEEQAQSNLDLSELKASVAAARRAGDLEKRLADLQQHTSEEKAACESELSRLGRFTGTIEELSKIAMPESETLDRYERLFDDLDENIRDYKRCRKELEEDQKKAKQELNALLLTSDVPTISGLEAVRSERNTGWNLIKRKYIEKTDVEKDIACFAPDCDLPTYYEQKVYAADNVSDRMRSAADQVVKRADIEAGMESLKSRLNDTTEEIRKANEDREALQKVWNAVWEASGIEPGTPREMKQWLLKVDRLLANAQSADAASDNLKRLTEDYRALKQAVAIQISRFDDSTDLRKMGLEAMINLCEQRVEQEESALKRKLQLEHSLSETGISIKRTREKLKSIENDQDRWIQEWGQAIEGLGLKPDAHPEQATETFDKLAMFFEKFDKSEDLSRRIYGIDQVIKKFEEKLFKFADSIGYKRDGHEAGAIAAQLNSDLNKAREARASLKKVEKQEIEIKEEIQNIGITIRTAEEQLGALREQAGVETDEELESAGESSRKMREMQHKIETLEQELTRNGDGLSIQELETEASEADIDSIEGELERVSSELKVLHAGRDALRDQRQTLQNEINSKDGSAAAAEASEEAEQQLAAMVSGAEQYLRLQIAALILEQRIEDYRKKNQAPVLARAGEIFSRLTLGSYANLRDELDENNRPILLGVRPDDVEVSVEGMSDGTRDQLYLSLRLATLEQHLSKGEPMPFVVDDILTGFDDNRTKVCLEVFAELAASTQVLLFTHHRRVLELADALAAKKEIFTHELV